MNILCFGEPLVRLATVSHERLDEARNLDISYSGAETVVAITLAQQGDSVSFASRLSTNRLGTNALMNLARYGVDTSRVIRSSERMGLYYCEGGFSIRPTVVTYDRSGTAMACAHRDEFDWDRMLNGIGAFFFSGVTPAISEEMHRVCLDGLRACKGRGIHVIMDLNYRETMWTSRDEAHRKIGALMPYVDQLIASEDDILSYEGGKVEEDGLFDYCLSWAQGMMVDHALNSLCFIVRQIDRYGIASLRGGIVGHQKTCLSRTQRVSVADISSTGSVFAAGIVHADTCRWDQQFSVEYATMAIAFKATVVGDYSSAGESEIAQLLASGAKPNIRQ